MSILDRFRKKQTKEQLQAKGKKADSVSVAPQIDKAEKEVQQPKQEHHVVVPGARTAHRVLLRQLVTEKAAMLEAKGQYIFQVSIQANKPSIMQAVKELYGVWPDRVQVLKNDGKHVRFGRQYGKKKNWKKAMIVLPKGKTLHAAATTEKV